MAISPILGGCPNRMDPAMAGIMAVAAVAAFRGPRPGPRPELPDAAAPTGGEGAAPGR